MLATETLGSVSVICSDKTGTLTEGEMRVTEIITETETIVINNNFFIQEVDFNKHSSYITALKISLLCNDALLENDINNGNKFNIIGNPTEKALLSLALSNDLDRSLLVDNEPRVFELPFESEHKFMITGHSCGNNILNSYAKGAPEKILEFSDYIDKDGKIEVLTQEKKEEIIKKYESLNSTGLRVIAVSMRKEDSSLENFSLDKDNLHGFVFVGLFALKDPLRSEAKETINLCKQAGIRPIIITGDHKLTAIAIVKDLGLEVLEKNVLEGFELDGLSDEELRRKVNEIIIFARVEPKHKIRIVQALQENGEVVAMTGDGVNDAPALKKADIGVAVGSGTDVAKDTADLVLLDDNFKTIVGAVKRGRGIFNNIRKVVLYLLSNSFTEVLLIGLCIILNLPLALLPVQILWIKMLEDSLPSMALAFDPVDDGVMKLAPRNKNENILTLPLKKTLLFFIIISDLLLFVIFYYSLSTTGDIIYAQTIAFVGLGIASRFYMFSIRNLEKPIYRYNPFENKWVNWTSVFGLAMIAVAVYVPFFNKILHTTPLGIKDWLILLSYGLITIVIYEIGKKIFIVKKNTEINFFNKKTS